LAVLAIAAAFAGTSFSGQTVSFLWRNSPFSAASASTHRTLIQVPTKSKSENLSGCRCTIYGDQRTIEAHSAGYSSAFRVIGAERPKAVELCNAQL
jgi:hypothetical protein